MRHGFILRIILHENYSSSSMFFHRHRPLCTLQSIYFSFILWSMKCVGVNLSLSLPLSLEFNSTLWRHVYKLSLCGLCYFYPCSLVVKKWEKESNVLRQGQQIWLCKRKRGRENWKSSTCWMSHHLHGTTDFFSPQQRTCDFCFHFNFPFTSFVK